RGTGVRTALIAPLTAASFQRIGGLPLIQRTVLSAVRTGFDRIIVVADQYADRVRALLNADERTRNVDVVRDGTPLPALAESLVTVIAGDCALTPATLQRVNAGTVDDRPVLFTSAGAVSLALCRAAALAGVDAHGLATGRDALLAAIRAQGAATVALDGEVCVQVRDASSAEEAERALCARMRADSAGSDGPLAHWVDRHLSLRVSRYLVEHTRLRPNHITLIGTLIGLLAA